MNIYILQVIYTLVYKLFTPNVSKSQSDFSAGCHFQTMKGNKSLVIIMQRKSAFIVAPHPRLLYNVGFLQFIISELIIHLVNWITDLESTVETGETNYEIRKICPVVSVPPSAWRTIIFKDKLRGGVGCYNDTTFNSNFKRWISLIVIRWYG